MRQEVAVGDPEHSGGTHAKSKQPGEAVPKDDKIGKHWVIFNPSGSQLSGCKSSTMAEVSLTQTHTHTDVNHTHTHTQQASTSRKTVVQ